MTHESLNPDGGNLSLSAQLDRDTGFMSGGFEKLDTFQELVGLGAAVLPELLAELSDPGWWRIQAICTIADNMGQPIVFPDEIRGRYVEVSLHILDWAEMNGYIA